MARPQPALVVIVGPIAAGKSTLAAAVAQQLRARGEAVAVVGLDTVAGMALPTLDWAWAHEVHGDLVRAWRATPVRTVIAEGPSTAAEVDRLMRCVPRDVDVFTVVLTTRYEVALRRAQQDPDRGRSKDPKFLEQDHDRFQSSRPHLTCDLIVDSSDATPSTLAERVTRALDGRRSAPEDCH